MKLKIIIALVMIANLIQANEIKLITEVFSPYQFKNKNGNLSGISIDIVKAIQNKIGDTSKVKLYPWARGVKILDKKENTALFSMMRTKTRENKYKWVGPIDELEIVFFKKKGSNIPLKSVDDARKVGKIGVTRKVANHDILSAMKFKNLVVFGGSDDKNIRKLLKGKIDLWPYKEPKTLSASVRILSFMAKDKHLDPDIFKLFLSSGIYKEYAKQYLKPEQIDEVDLSLYLG